MCYWNGVYIGAKNLGVNPTKLDNVYLGRTYNYIDILNSINTYNLKYNVSNNLALDIAECLNLGENIVVTQGGSEFGLRALGNRHILVRLDLIEIRDKLNIVIKHLVQKRFVSKYFSENFESPYMMFVTNVLDERLKGKSHYDGTARIQTITHIKIVCFMMYYHNLINFLIFMRV